MGLASIGDQHHGSITSLADFAIYRKNWLTSNVPVEENAMCGLHAAALLAFHTYHAAVPLSVTSVVLVAERSGHEVGVWEKHGGHANGDISDDSAVC